MNIYRLLIVLFGVTALVGCSGGSPKATAEDAHNHEESLQLTAYSDQFEVFAEATPFVVGHESEIIAHFSYLENFKPITAGKITMSLIVGTDGIRQTLEQPTKTGIYLFHLKPEKAGSGKVLFEIETAEGKSQIVVSDIVVYTDEHDAQHAAADAAVSSSNGVVFTKEQSWKVNFATEQARLEPFGQIIRTTAQILPSQGDQRIISAQKGGVVLFLGQNIVDGKSVKAGQSLFAIESGGMADNNMNVRYSEAAAEYKRAKTEYERKKELAKDKIVSEIELLNAQTEFAVAEAVYNNLNDNFVAGKQIISSPINGYVTQVLVRNGEYVESGQPVLLVSQNKDLLIKAELQPKYYSLLDNITSANIRVMNGDLKYALEELGGKVVSYGKSSDLNNPLIPVIFQVNNSVGLFSGSFVEMFIKTKNAEEAITVTNESIVEEMGNYFVFVQLTPEFFEKRLVVRGVTDGFRTQIVEGISANDRVVSKGAILVKLAQSSGALDAHSGHVH